jgi:predicted DNA-binding transcriptional regulator AlpA
MKRFLNVEEAAAHLGVSKSWLYALWSRGMGPPRSKIAGRTFVSIEALDAWVREMEVRTCG